MPLVDLAHVSKTYSNGVEALSGLELAVEEGEFVTLIGPSGCGKSTVLRLIAALDAPSAGSVSWPGGRPDLGYVFQEPTLMPWASVFDNIWLPLRLAGQSRRQAEAAISEAMELVGLADFARARPDELSGGMKMRVSIARALVTRPRLLLMDEPFAALDEITRFRLNDELLALKQRLGFTVVFVTHSVFEAVYLSSRIVVMTPRPGRIAGEFSIPEKVRDDAFRTSTDYAGHARAVSGLLRQENGESRVDTDALRVHS